jgi:hypothetical protein
VEGGAGREEKESCMGGGCAAADADDDGAVAVGAGECERISTLDLLGKADPCLDLDFLPSPDFLHLDPEEPLPSGWEKCLDLKVEFWHVFTELD